MMQRLRNLGRVFAALWLVGVLVLGVGGSILTRGGEKPLHVALGELQPEINEEDGSPSIWDMREDAQADRRQKREERRDARALSEEGWGTQTDMDGGWGTGS